MNISDRKSLKNLCCQPSGLTFLRKSERGTYGKLSCHPMRFSSLSLISIKFTFVSMMEESCTTSYPCFISSISSSSSIRKWALNALASDHELYNILHIGVQKNVPLLMPVGVHSKQFVQSINEMNVDTQLFCNTHGVPCSAASYNIRGFAVNEFRS